MRVLVHDFAGHPFQAELSRVLAARGMHVTHAWFAGDSGPKGRLTRQPQDAATLEFCGLGAGIAYSKSNFLKRRSGDIRYGREVATKLHALRPDLVISGNTPTEAQEPIVAACRALGIPFVYWCQDFYAIAATRLLRQRLGGLGAMIGAYYQFLERRQMQRAASVLLIAEEFRIKTAAWGICDAKTEVIPNWGALAEIDVLDRDTAWARRQGLRSGARFVYSGTLAMKHNPALLTGLAQALCGEDEVVLIAAGVGAEAIAAQKARGALARLRLLPLQPFGDLAQALAAGDVLLAVIERDAGSYSVPSKILSYLCAGRPIVLAAPKENLAARIITQAQAGVVVEPEDIAGFVQAALDYRQNSAKARAAGNAGRAYSEAHFNLEQIADRFEALFHASLGPARAGVKSGKLCSASLSSVQIRN